MDGDGDRILNSESSRFDKTVSKSKNTIKDELCLAAAPRPNLQISPQSSSPSPFLPLPHADMVRLITHNLLACHVKGCTSNNFPLQFQDVQIEMREADFNPDFLRGFMPKIEWQALVDSARQVRRPKALPTPRRIFFFNQFRVQLGDTSLPPEMPEMMDDEFLKTLHHVLFEVCFHV